MSSLVFPDPMVDLSYWLRNDPILNPLHGGRVFLKMPRLTIAPTMRISRIGGGQQPDSEAPVQDIQVLMQVWGLQDRDYTAVRQLVIAIEHVCHQLPHGTLINPQGNTKVHNAAFNTAYDSPDPTTGWPRMICHTTFTCTASVPTVV